MRARHSTNRRAAIGPILVPVLLFALTAGLGVWQIERLHWKQAILARIEAAQARPPAPLGAAPVTRFERVTATGALRADLASSYASDVRDGRNGPVFGVFLLEPLVRAGGPPVLVDLGWVPADPHGHPAITVSGTRTVTGYVRTAEKPSLFTPRPDGVRRQFYALDPAAIGPALGVALAPFTLVAVGPDEPGVFPQPAETLPQPPNNHLEYALTWFTMACIVLVGSIVWWRGNLALLNPGSRKPSDRA